MCERQAAVNENLKAEVPPVFEIFFHPSTVFFTLLMKKGKKSKQENVPFIKAFKRKRSSFESAFPASILLRIGMRRLNPIQRRPGRSIQGSLNRLRR